MALQTYPVVLEPAEDGGFGVIFPDLDGCISAGESYETALDNAADALCLHLEGMAEDGIAYPERSSVLDVSRRYGDIVESGGYVALVKAEAPDASERVNVYLSKSLLDRVDRYCRRAGMNRSTFFSLAARAHLDARQSDVAARGALRAYPPERQG